MWHKHELIIKGEEVIGIGLDWTNPWRLPNNDTEKFLSKRQCVLLKTGNINYSSGLSWGTKNVY